MARYALGDFEGALSLFDEALSASSSPRPHSKFLLAPLKNRAWTLQVLHRPVEAANSRGPTSLRRIVRGIVFQGGADARRVAGATGGALTFEDFLLVKQMCSYEGLTQSALKAGHSRGGEAIALKDPSALIYLDLLVRSIMHSGLSAAAGLTQVCARHSRFMV